MAAKRNRLARDGSEFCSVSLTTSCIVASAIHASCCTQTRSHTTNTRYPHLQSSSRIMSSSPHLLPASPLSRQTFDSSFSPPPPLPPDSVYTSCYCEENIYLLAQNFLAEAQTQASRGLAWPWEIYVVFISNRGKTVRVSIYSSPRFSTPPAVSSADCFSHLRANRSRYGLKSYGPRRSLSGITMSFWCCDQPRAYPTSRVLIFCARTTSSRHVPTLVLLPRTSGLGWHRFRRPKMWQTDPKIPNLPLLTSTTPKPSLWAGSTTLTRR